MNFGESAKTLIFTNRSYEAVSPFRKLIVF